MRALAWVFCGLAVAQPAMNCGGVAVCGVLTLESGFGQGTYQHATPCPHGLWPEVPPYGNSQCVTPKDLTPPSTVFACYKDSGQNSSSIISFEQHEWSAHGKCSGARDATDFFSQICKLSAGPLAAMKGLKTLAAMQTAVARAGFEVFEVDTVNAQLSVSMCLSATGQWVFSAVKDFASVCPKGSPTPAPAEQCVKGQRGPPCANNTDCTKLTGCIRCAKTKFCTDEPAEEKF